MEVAERWQNNTALFDQEITGGGHPNYTTPQVAIEQTPSRSEDVGGRARLPT
jgi:hypothetical protein